MAILKKKKKDLFKGKGLYDNFEKKNKIKIFSDMTPFDLVFKPDASLQNGGHVHLFSDSGLCSMV